MSGLIPSKRQRGETSGNGGALAPLRDFPTLVRRMQSEFDELVQRFAQNWPVPWRDQGNGWRWGLDVEDKEDRVVVRAEAPGFEAGDFDIRVSDNRLILRAVHQTEAKEKAGEIREQRECYDFVTLPAGVDADKIDASYRSGLLTVTIPKTAAAKGKRIAVKAS